MEVAILVKPRNGTKSFSMEGHTMLVLTRRLGEEIVIGGIVCVRIISIEGGKVRIGISAPESITVDRREVHDRRTAFQNSEIVVSPPSG